MSGRGFTDEVCSTTGLGEGETARFRDDGPLGTAALPFGTASALTNAATGAAGATGATTGAPVFAKKNELVTKKYVRDK